VTFVSAASTVDRLHSLQVGEQVWVSNSLSCLLARSGATLDPTCWRYARIFKSITRGIRSYERILATSAGPVRLTYYRNLSWSEGQLAEVEKPPILRDFSGFARYRSFLEGSLEALARNMAAGGRGRPYTMLAAMSSGYDSPTVAALARRFGLREVISIEDSREGAADSGREIASHLGLETFPARRDAWRSASLAEVPFIAADAQGEEVYFAAFEHRLGGRALLTGFHGDKVWDKSTKTLTDDIRRGDHSGLSLTEYRLRVGFIHCPVPFMGVRQIRDICSIGNAAELASWDIGGDYSRPICRRIVEGEGVPGNLFGTVKKASSVLFYDHQSFLSPNSREDYTRWLEQNAGAWLARQRIPPRVVARPLAPIQAAARILAGTLRPLAEGAPPRLERLKYLLDRLEDAGRREFLFYFMFPWATERAKAAYAMDADSEAEPADGHRP
jgi:hypothetical protein